MDPDNYFIPIGEQTDLFNLEPEKHGWERFGQDHRSDIKPFIEGPWMVKHDGTYYLDSKGKRKATEWMNKTTDSSGEFEVFPLGS